MRDQDARRAVERPRWADHLLEDVLPDVRVDCGELCKIQFRAVFNSFSTIYLTRPRNFLDYRVCNYNIFSATVT